MAVDDTSQTASSRTKEFEEHAAQRIDEAFSADFAIVLLHEWGGAGVNALVPASVLAPQHGGEHASLDAENIRQVTENKNAVLVPCTFESKDEELAMQILLPQVAQNTSAYIIALQLLPPGCVLDDETMEVLLARHKRIVACNPDNVLLNPDLDPGKFRSLVKSACVVANLHAQRAELTFHQASRPDPEPVMQLEAQLQQLLWVDCVRVLMSNIPRVDPHLHEEPGRMVGSFRLLNQFQTRSAEQVYEAADDASNKLCVIKVIEKRQVTSPGELEGIYRELVLTSSSIEHPNIAKCRACLHSHKYLYLQFDYAGPVNLAQHLAEQPGCRLSCVETDEVFTQISAAITYCHGKKIAHRDIALEHVVVDCRKGNSLSCSLVDFRSAIIVEASATSRTRTGSPPCVAPEILAGEAYVPRLADRWSLGALLLDMAGGLGSMRRAVRWPAEDKEPALTAQRLRACFAREGCHAEALALQGGQADQLTLQRLQGLLQLDPRRRSLGSAD